MSNLSYLKNVGEESTADLVHVEVVQTEEVGDGMPDGHARRHREDVLVLKAAGGWQHPGPPRG